MKNAKLIISLLVVTIILLVVFIVGKGTQSPEKKAQAEYERGRQERNKQQHESADRMSKNFR